MLRLVPWSRTRVSIVWSMLFLASVCLLAQGQQLPLREAIPAEGVEGFSDNFAEPLGTPVDAFSYVPPAPVFRTAAKTAIFNVIYDEEFPTEARQAFDAATNTWCRVLYSTVPIVIEAKWVEIDEEKKTDQPQPAQGLKLGKASVPNYRRDFKGAPVRGVWYPIALANRFANEDLNPKASDIIVRFNRRAPWYLATDGATPAGKYDFLSVALHEIAHGLGFATSLKIEGKQSIWGLKDKEGRASPTVYDAMLRTVKGQQLTDQKLFPVPSETLFKEVTNQRLLFGGKLATAMNGGVPPAIFAPTTVKLGASFVHLHEATYPPGNLNSLMTPYTYHAEAIQHPGPVTLGILRDLGWGEPVAPQMKDQESTSR